jgi:SAM-dependent methyltransferase
MDHEGMVHVLEDIKRLIRPNGCLIDIHPVREAPIVDVRARSRILFSATSPGFDYDDDLRHAEDALATALERQLFVLDGSHEFEFLTTASSVEELRDFFAVQSAYEEDPVEDDVQELVDALYARVEDVMRRTGEEARVVHRERARASRLRPVG